MKYISLLSFTLLIITSKVQAQTIYGMDTYDGTTITACQGQLWDSQNWDSFWGSCTGIDEYCTNEDYVVTINSGDPAQVVRLNFLFYNIELGADQLTFYDGPNTGSPVISTLSGFGATGITTSASAFVVTSTQQYLTVRFTSDGAVNFEDGTYYGGFQALIGCEMQDCGPTTPAADDNCGTATVMCDLNGYCGSTSGWYTAGLESAALGSNYGGPFCGSIENNSWVEFTADATSASFTITSSGCDDPASGIQAMIFDTDCSTFTPVSNCINQTTAPGTDVLSATGLTVGNTYYIMIDGYAGNACDYEITANTGVQVVDITSTAGSNVCPGQCTDLTVNATGATSYSWTSSPAGTTGSTATINVCPAVTTTYTCTVTGICGGTQTVSYTVDVVNPTVDFHALDGGFNPIAMPTTVECDDPAFYLEADDSATAGGYISPALHFIFTSDGFATTDPSSVNIYSGGPPGVGTLIYSQNPLDDNTELTVYGEYLSPSTDYYIEICDGFGDGGVDYEVVDGNTNVTYASGSIASGNPCEVFGPFSPAGLSNWNSTAPAASWSSNDAGLLFFDPSIAGVGSYDFTYSWDNTLGCSGSNTRTIDVVDSQAPTITCPANVTQANDPGGCDAAVFIPSPVTSDNCSVVSIVNDYNGTANASDTYPVGSTTVTWTVTDGGGNTTSCSHTVTINDTEDPVINCPSNSTVNNDPGNCSAVVNYTTPVGTDNCPGATTTQVAGLASGSAFPIGTTTNTFEVTDAAGNTATCSFDVTVNDTEDPVINCPANITVSNDPGNCSAVVTYSVTASDNCPGETVTQTAGLSSGSTFPIGTTTNTFEVTDAAGNTVSCSFDVTVNDTENPTINCPGNITVSNDPGNCSALVTYSVTASDNCPGETLTQTAGLSSGAAFPIGTTTNTFEVTDASGNTVTCSFDVTVNDTEDPTISCPSDVTVNNDPGACSALVNFTAPVGSDNCPGATTTQIAGLASGSAFPIGTTTNTFEVTDASGNTVTCSFDVTVNDTEDPTINCPANITVSNDPGNCSAVVNFTVPTSDNCPGESITQTTGLPSGSAFPAGTTTNTFVVTDAAGNTATCSFDVTVNDTEDPTINCPADMTVGNDPGNCSAVVNYTVPTSDNCPGETITQTTGLPSGSAFPVGTTTNTFIVTDAAGNTATCSFDITVNDTENTPPTITGDTEYCAGGSASISTQSYVDYAWSNGSTSQSTTVTTADNPITVTVTFANGCTGTSAPYNVTENPNPQISVTPTDPTVCNGTDGYITVNSVSGSTSGDVSWTGTASGTDNGIGLPHDITGLGAGNYNITFTDNNGCSSNVESTVLTNPGAPIIDNITDTSSCEVDFVVPDPTTYITGTNLTGNQAFYSASGGNAADEIPQGTVITSAMSPMTIYVYDNSGTCSSEISFVVEVNENPIPAISPDPAIICEGSSINLDGNPAGGSGTYTTHDWTGDVSILSATNIQSPSTLTGATYGSYNLTYTVTDDNGCTGTDNITVEINEMPVLSGDQEICEDEVTTISSTGSPDGTSPWTSSDPSIATVNNSGDVTGVSGGTVDITFLDANGCSELITITVNPKPTITLTPNDPSTCNGTDGYITVDGAGTGTVDWSGDATGSVGSTTLPYDITNLEAGNYTVTFTDDITGCESDVASTTLNNPGAPVIDMINDTSSCEVDFVIPDPTTYITGNNLTGNQAFYSAPGGNPGDELVQGTTITNGMSPMTVYVFDNNGVCESETSFTVYVNENPTVAISPNPIDVCTDEAIQVNGNPSGGSGNYVTHDWTNTAAGDLDDQTIPNPTYTTSAAGNYDLTYTVEDDNGCTTSETIPVTVVERTVIDPIAAIVSCGELPLDSLPTISGTNLSGNEAYYDDTQANGGQIVSGPITSSGTYYAFDTGGNCSNEVMVDVTINDVPQITSSLTDTAYCDYEVPDDIVLTVTGQPNWNVEYTLDGLSQTATSSQNTINLGNAPGVYNITYIEDDVCSDTVDIEFELILKPTPPAPDVFEDAEYCQSDELDSMRAEGTGGVLSWYVNDFQQFYGTGSKAMPQDMKGTNVYYITETMDGCESDASEITIQITDCGFTLSTAITPDNDGLNDTWILPKLDVVYPDNVVQVYNRWGSLVFEHDSSKDGPYNDNPWDGTINGKALPVGSYFFVIDHNDGSDETTNGAVSIILD